MPAPSPLPTTFTHRATRWFIAAFLAAVLLVAGYAAWTAARLDRDPELREQLQEVHQRAARGEAPTDTTGR